MHHLAIMKASWKLTKEIPLGNKTIETRWYNSRRTPWNKIKTGDVIFFKDSGRPVSVQAEVEQVEQIQDLDELKTNHIIEKIWRKDVVHEDKIIHLKSYSKGKCYCIIIHLINAKEIEPFNISKKGFGLQSAWITLPDINSIKIDKL